MRNKIKIITAIVTCLMISFMVSSCEDKTNRTTENTRVDDNQIIIDDEEIAKADPADNTFFIGKYEGHITYNDSSDDANKIDVKNGSVEVAKAGKSYSFLFSNKIPNITNVMFEENDANSVISIDSDGSHFIKINGNNLEIHYIKDNEEWIANCTR